MALALEPPDTRATDAALSAVDAMRNAARTLDLAADFALRDLKRPVVSPGVIALPFYWCADRHRAEVTRKVFHHYRNVADALGLDVVGLGSEGETSRRLWSEFFDSTDYHEFPQAWTGSTSGAGSAALRAKFDETVRAARRFGAERVFIGGSDDIIGVEFFRRAFASDADVVGIAKGDKAAVRIVRLARSVVVEWDGRYEWAPDLKCCGGGLVLSRRLLDEWDWAPFRDEGDEVGVERRARADGFAIEALDPRACGFDYWAVKTERSVLNGWRQVQRVTTRNASIGTSNAFAELWASL